MKKTQLAYVWYMYIALCIVSESKTCNFLIDIPSHKLQLHFRMGISDWISLNGKES